MRLHFLARSSLAIFVMLAACGDQASNDDGGGPSHWQANGDNGALSFDLVSDGPLAEGKHDFTLTISGADTTTLAIAARIDMPAMSHGHTDLAVDAATPPNEYAFDDVDLDMPGSWRLVIEATDDGTVVDTATFSLEVH